MKFKVDIGEVDIEQLLNWVFDCGIKSTFSPAQGRAQDKQLIKTIKQCKKSLGE